MKSVIVLYKEKLRCGRSGRCVELYSLFVGSPKDSICLRRGGHVTSDLCHSTDVTKLVLSLQGGSLKCARGHMSLPEAIAKAQINFFIFLCTSGSAV